MRHSQINPAPGMRQRCALALHERLHAGGGDHHFMATRPGNMAAINEARRGPKYPDRDVRSLLEDLITRHGRKGKRFAVAKTACYLHIAPDCAADREAAPVRTACCFAIGTGPRCEGLRTNVPQACSLYSCRSPKPR